MAKIEERTARKNYPANGIKKGDRYYYVTVKTGPRSSRTIRSLTRPKHWELTGSEFYSTLWRIEDERFDAVNGAQDLKDIAEELRQLGEKQQEKFDNMPEGLQQGATGQLLEERAQNCEAWADDIENAADELESALKEFDAAIEPWTAYHKARNEWDDADEDERGDEPDEPDASLPSCLDGIDLSDESAVAEARHELINEKVSEASDANPGIN
jgi:DNA-binding ferritin-like protein